MLTARLRERSSARATSRPLSWGKRPMRIWKRSSSTAIFAGSTTRQPVVVGSRGARPRPAKGAGCRPRRGALRRSVHRSPRDGSRARGVPVARSHWLPPSSVVRATNRLGRRRRWQCTRVPPDLGAGREPPQRDRSPPRARGTAPKGSSSRWHAPSQCGTSALHRSGSALRKSDGD